MATAEKLVDEIVELFDDNFDDTDSVKAAMQEIKAEFAAADAARASAYYDRVLVHEQRAANLISLVGLMAAVSDY